MPVGITPTPQEGSTDTPPEGNTDNPLVGIPTHPLSVLPTYPQVVLPTAPKGVLPKTPKGSGDCPQKVVGTIYRRLNNSPTAPFQRSAVHQATLRRTFDNSPPYFDASRAESRVKQGGEFRHIGRRFSPWTTEILIEQGGVMADVTKGIARTAPLNAWNDGKNAVLRQSPQPPEQARGVLTLRAKTQIPHRVCKHEITALCTSAPSKCTCLRTYFHASGRRMRFPCVPTGISSGS